MEILSKRLHKPLHEITKRGGGSWIVQPIAVDVGPAGSKKEER
jgi:hypothetical protein